MMTGVVIALLLLGVLLILLEIVFVPGTTVVGIGGVILLGIGIYVAYTYLGSNIGHLSLGTSVVIIFLALLVVLKGDTWERVSLKNRLEGRSSTDLSTVLKAGDRGKTISRLNPIGKALFNEEMYEVSASGEFVDADEEVEIIKVEQNSIKVKTIKA